MIGIVYSYVQGKDTFLHYGVKHNLLVSKASKGLIDLMWMIREASRKRFFTEYDFLQTPRKRCTCLFFLCVCVGDFDVRSVPLFPVRYI